MSYRRTLIFLIAFILLIVFYYFYEIRGGEARREAERTEKLLFSIHADNVTGFTLERPEETIVVQRDADAWRISEPVSAPAETNTISQILDTLVDLTYERDIGAQVDLQPFGLTEPKIKIGVIGDEGELGELLLGSSTPDGSKVYVKLLDGESVFTVGKSAKDHLDKNLFALRDKKVFNFSASDVKALTFTRDENTLVFEKDQDDEWTMTSPESHAADTGRIISLLDSIRFARVREFMEDDPADIRKYGLDVPLSRVELELDSEKMLLYFGEKPEPDSERIFARRNDESQILKLDDDIFEKLLTTIDDWREKRLVKFQRDKVVRLQIHSPVGPVTIERSADNYEEWNITEPEQALADEDEIGNLLAGLQNAKIIGFLKKEEQRAAERIIEKPAMEVMLWEKDNETAATLLLSKTEDKPDVFARTEEGGEIFLVDEGLLSRLSVEPAELRDKSAIRFEETDIAKIEIASVERTHTIQRRGVDWKIPKGLDMEPYEIDQFLWDLSALNYRAIGPRVKDDKSYGFDSPALLIELWGADDENPLRFIVGRSVPERNTYYALGDDEQVMEIDGAIVSEWVQKY